MTTTSRAHVQAVREFNRFYTREIGVLRRGLLDSAFSLAEARVLYELAHRDRPAAREIGADLGLDAGYLSRILRGFQARRLIARAASASDRRRSMLSLTPKGRAAFDTLDAATNRDAAARLARLPSARQQQLIAAMRTIHDVLDHDGGPPASARAEPFIIRSHEPGDMGWVVHRHGALYAQEYGYDQTFEALVARIVADFVDRFDPSGERCWIAERDGEIVGSVFLVRKTKTIAKLRLLLVEPSARGLGLGRRLVDECIGFARQRGYRRLTLWTHGQLTAARRAYEHAGFVRVRRRPHHSFGLPLVDETWDLDLRRRPA